jgi:hypothetical protein
VRALRAAGLRVEHDEDGPTTLREARADPPDVFVIDLTRLPSYGREMAWAIRRSPKLRAVPLVFAGGVPEKVARVKGELPDAAYVEWEGVAAAAERAAAAPPRDPVVPRSEHFHGSKPLAGKLGLKPGGTMALVEAPPGFEQVVGALPEGCTLRRGLRGTPEHVLWFVRSREDLEKALPRWTKAVTAGARLWVAWPKKGSSVPTDLAQDVVRTTPHAHGLVDYKICALDADWSGMCFGMKQGTRPARKKA